MTITEKIEGEKITLALTGRLETTTSAELKKTLEPIWEKGELDIELDFSDLQFISSAGLRLLLTTENRCSANGRALTVTGVSPIIREIFDITGFSDMLSIV